MEDVKNRSFSDSPCTLNLSYSSSSFEWSDCSIVVEVADDVDEGPSGIGVEWYLYEPEAL